MRSLSRRDFVRGALAWAASPDSALERLARHRNLGKAYYENPATVAQAIDEFREALTLTPGSPVDRVNLGLALLRAGRTREGAAELEAVQRQDPRIPHTWFNLAIVHKREGRLDEARRQFERLLELVPGEPISRYNLGVLYKLEGRPDAARRELEAAARLDPDLAAPHYQLHGLHRQAGRSAEAERHLRAFQDITKRREGAAVPEDTEWSVYAEVWETIDSAASADAAGPAPDLRVDVRKVASGMDPANAGLAVLDADGDGRPDLLAWSRTGVRLLRHGTTEVSGSGLGGLRDVVSVAVGDFDNDGLADLCVVTGEGPVLFRNRKGRFERLAITLPRDRFEQALWLDYDHDYDLDLFLLGPRSILLRNRGTGAFDDRPADFPFAPGHALDAVAFRVVPDTATTDVVVSYLDRPGVLYRDRLGGKFDPEPLDALPAGSRGLVARDRDNDGWIDLLATTPRGPLLLTNRRGRFEATGGGVAGSGGLLPVDLENRGLLDLVVGDAIHRALGAGRLEPRPTPAGFPRGVVWAEADFDLDGRTDLAAIGADGSVYLVRNRTATAHRWLGVALTGTKNLRLAPGAEIEVKAGSLYQKCVYRGVPLAFGLRDTRDIDTVRITWPNGLIQNVPRQRPNRLAAYREAQRLSGSCPMIFAWSGERFDFVADVLGVAPLGAAAGDGQFFPVDHDEYVQVPATALRPRDGALEIRITEELREVSYLDAVHLIAVDRPAEIAICTNDKFIGPPFPEFRLFGVRRPIHPSAARDHRGRSVRARLLRRDGRYVVGFRRDMAGVAESHALELDFPAGAAPDGRAILVLHGWLDWPDGSTFLGRAQDPATALAPPSLQVLDAHGAWRTVIDDMGVPAGHPKTIVVDLTGKFLSPARRVRIVTNLVVYWEEIFLSEETAPPEVRLTRLRPDAADLRFRGFSRAVIDRRRRKPEAFVYQDVLPTSMWNPTPGLYTRYGDVRELLLEVDDRLVIMGSGDELALRFRAADLPRLPAGWTRDYLLLVDGWAKDGDLNTAFCRSVEPLPFHGMSGYPYGPLERHPDEAAHREWRTGYQTRGARRLIPTLARD